MKIYNLIMVSLRHLPQGIIIYFFLDLKRFLCPLDTRYVVAPRMHPSAKWARGVAAAARKIGMVSSPFRSVFRSGMVFFHSDEDR